MIGHGSNKGIVPITCGELFQAIEQVDKAKKEIQVGDCVFYEGGL